MSSPRPLVERLKPCGPVVDAGAAKRAHESLAEAADKAGWSALLQTAWPALEPVFAASPYLAGLAKRRPAGRRRRWKRPPLPEAGRRAW